jgi:hypothetical protein
MRNYSFQWPEEYDEAMNRMRLAASILTERDQELLAKLWRAALAAAASIDPHDFSTPAGHRVYRRDFHDYYEMVSGMVKSVLQEKNIAELRKKSAELEPEDTEDVPF